MATAAKLPSYPHIGRAQGVRGGKACIRGTRIAVVDIVIAHQQGHTPEEIQSLFSSRPLTLAEVHAALAHHYDHPEEVAEYRHRSEQILRETETARAAYLSRRAKR